jgi:ribosome-associated protein
MSEVVQLDSLMHLSHLVVDGMQEKKAKGITLLDLRSLPNRSVDVYIICHGDNDRQVEAIASSVEEMLWQKSREKVWHREGYENREWILLDYVNFVVHIFQKEKREFYALEELWGDAKAEYFSDTE